MSAFHTSPTAAAVTSGTSAAAPFVAGVAALYLERYPDASPRSVSQSVVSQATVDVIDGAGDGSPNRLLYSLIGSLDNTQGDSQLLGDPGFEFVTTFRTLDICTVVNPGACPPTSTSSGEYPSRAEQSRCDRERQDFHVVSES